MRFVEVSHNLNFINGTGWDTHNDGILEQHVLIRELDHALSTLVLDLERQQMLDKTLVVVASEFGRPAGFDGGGGRGHHSKAFTVALAGGGLNNGKTIGLTDELGMNIVERPVSVPDLHATICWALGINPSEELYTPDDRPVPITDGGKPIDELFASRLPHRAAGIARSNPEFSGVGISRHPVQRLLQRGGTASGSLRVSPRASTLRQNGSNGL